MRIETVYCLYVALTSFGVAVPFTAYAPFLRSIGLTLGEIGLVNAVFWTLYALFELPTGMCADGRSRAWSVERGVLLQAAGSIAYFFADGFWDAVAAEAVFAMGEAFASGARQAWLVDALRAEGRGKDARRAFGTAAVVSGAAMIAGGLFGGLLLRASPAAVWIPYALGAVPTLMLVRRHMAGRGDPERRVTEREALAKSVALLRSSRALRWAIVAAASLGLVLPFSHYWSSYFIAAFGDGAVGWVWAFMYGTSVLGGWLVRRFHASSANESTPLAAALGCAGLGMALIPAFGGAAGPLAAVALHEVGRGAFEPLMEAFTHRRVESDHRATYASLQSLVGKAGFAAVPLAAWALIGGLPDTPATVGFAWTCAGTLLAVVAVVLWFVRPNDR